MKQQIIKTDAVLTPAALEKITELQEDNNEFITDICQECEKIARWFRQKRNYIKTDIDNETIFQFNDTLDSIRDILESFKQEGGTNESN